MNDEDKEDRGFEFFARLADDDFAIPDLEPFQWLDGEYTGLTAVGWWGRKCSFPRGKVPLQVLERLVSELEQGSFQPSEITAHKYSCTRCDSSIVYSATTRFGVIWVPAGTQVFLAPGNLVHLLHDHDYRPPAQFVEAVEHCPKPGSLAYYDLSRCAVWGEGTSHWRRESAAASERAANMAAAHLKSAICPYCERPLRTRKARQCFECGLDWHNVNHVRSSSEQPLDSAIPYLFSSLQSEPRP